MRLCKSDTNDRTQFFEENEIQLTADGFQLTQQMAPREREIQAIAVIYDIDKDEIITMTFHLERGIILFTNNSSLITHKLRGR